MFLQSYQYGSNVTEKCQEQRCIGATAPLSLVESSSGLSCMNLLTKSGLNGTKFFGRVGSLIQVTQLLGLLCFWRSTIDFIRRLGGNANLLLFSGGALLVDDSKSMLMGCIEVRMVWEEFVLLHGMILVNVLLLGSSLSLCKFSASNGS